MNCAFVTAGGVLRHPNSTTSSPGCTVKRLLELASRLVDRASSKTWWWTTSVAEAKASAEMMLIGSSIYVAPSCSGTIRSSGTESPARDEGDA